MPELTACAAGGAKEDFGIKFSMRHNYTFLILLVVSAVIFGLFICPALKMHQMGWMCYAFYGLVVVVFLFGRIAGVGGPRPRSRP